MKNNLLPEILNKLNDYYKRKIFLKILYGLLFFVIIISAILLTVSLFELLGNFNSLVRTIIFFAGVITLSGFFIYFIVYPLILYFRRITDVEHLSLAEEIGRFDPQIKDELRNSIELVISDNNNNYSSSLTDAAFENIYNRTKNIDFISFLSLSLVKNILSKSLITFVAALILFIFFPGLSNSAFRIINFDKEFIPPPKFTLFVEPGNIKKAKGENVAIKIKASGDVPSLLNLSIKFIDETDFKDIELRPDSNGNFIYNIQSIRNTFEYFAFSGNISSDKYSVEVVNFPVIQTFNIKVIPPSYSNLPVIELRDNGNFSALKGSSVKIDLVSSKELLGSKILFSDSTEKKMTINSNFAETAFNVTKDLSYKLVINDPEGYSNLNPISYNIKAMNDEYPAIEIIIPGKDTELPADDRLALQYKISDDYGFDKLILFFRLSSSRYEEAQSEYSSIQIPISKNSLELSDEYIWNLANLNPAVDDVFSYYLEIFDNDFVSGPKSSKTEVFNVRIPSLEELLAESEETKENSENELVEALEEADKLNKELEKISQELKVDKKEITWQEKEKIENAMKKVEELHEKISDVSQDLQEMQNKLQENNLLSNETLEKYMELQELFDELNNESMKEIMEKMQEMMQSLNRDQIQEMMSQMQFNEDQFKKNLERTLDLFKRLQIEQKFDDLMKMTEQLLEQQESLNKETAEKNSNQSKDQLSQKQDNITKELDKLEKQMESLSENMNEFKDMPSDEMKNMQSEFQEQQNQQMSREASQQMKQNQMKQAMQNQSQVSQNMQQLNQKMQDMQSQMEMESKMDMFKDMMRVTEQLIEMSKEQEQLKSDTQNNQNNRSASNENIQKQDGLSRSLDKIAQQMSDLGKKTFAISPELAKKLGDAKRNMQQSMQSMQNGNNSQASQQQGKSMSSLNEAAMLMQGSMEQMMQGGGQGGMMSMMQQLQQMAQQQMNLNNLTQMLGQGTLTPQQQAQLQRLAQEQDLIKKSMEQLEKESKISGKSKSLAGNLEEIIKKMREVVTDMQTEKYNDQLLQKQENILSRMLDATRSINERDFEKNRESNTGKNLVRQSPAELDLQKKRNFMNEELIKAVKEGYSKDYEILIRNYFELLQKKQIQN